MFSKRNVVKTWNLETSEKRTQKVDFANLNIFFNKTIHYFLEEDVRVDNIQVNYDVIKCEKLDIVHENLFFTEPTHMTIAIPKSGYTTHL